MKNKFSRRRFISTVSAGSLGVLAAGAMPAFGAESTSRGLAVLGGNPVRSKPWPQWPAMIVDDVMMESITRTTKSGAWSRINAPVNGTVASFEKRYAALMGVKYCVGTGSGTEVSAPAWRHWG